jgi:hypothetical protein
MACVAFCQCASFADYTVTTTQALPNSAINPYYNYNYTPTYNQGYYQNYQNQCQAPAWTNYGYNNYAYSPWGTNAYAYNRNPIYYPQTYDTGTNGIKRQILNNVIYSLVNR